jgi:7-carboxy-7-deazaguanine synthase
LSTSDRLRITEVFCSIQGEALDAGWPSAFIRLTGCPLRCTYCDTAYAFSGGEWRTFDALLEEVASFGVSHVCVTGGEPLAQPGCIELLRRLCDAGYSVSLETSGAIDIGKVDPRVSRIVDIKTPESGEASRNLLENLGVLQANDAVKFVVCNRDDYEWTREFIGEHPQIAEAECPVYLSPSHTELAAGKLADWMLEDRLNARLQVQLHKHLWGDEPGR